MQKNSEPRHHRRVNVEGKDFMIPTDSSDVKELLATARYFDHYSGDGRLLEESIVKLFNEAFDIDITTINEGEWAKRTRIKGGTLKQWQSFSKLRLYF
jgi:hypothetical protein